MYSVQRIFRRCRNPAILIRQVIDIPEIKVNIIEHRAEVKICPYCKSKNSAKFPKEVTNTIQYGESLMAATVYLTHYQLLPYKRSTELIEDLFNHHLSQGSLVTFNKDFYEKLEVIENNIRNTITSSSGAVHFDETDVYIDEKRNWIHVASNERFTYYESYEKHRQKATDKITILPNFAGTAVHDRFKYTKCNHALCNAYILRELNAVTKLQKQKWAEPIKNLLIQIKKRNRCKLKY